MTIPVLQYGPIFEAIAATATKELVSSVQTIATTSASPLDRATYARAIHLEINGGSTPNWTLAIQGKVSPTATYHNIDFIRVDQGTPNSVSATTLTVNWSTAQHYVIPNPPPFVQLVATRTGGTLTVFGAFSSEPYTLGAAGATVDTELPAVAALADATANPTTTTVAADVFGFNGTTWDRTRTKVPVAHLASAARTTTQTSADIATYNCGAIYIVLDMTVIGTGSVTLTVNFKDPASAKYIALLTGAAVVGNSTNVYKVAPGLTAVANTTVNDYLPDTLQIVVTANNANSATYSVGYVLIR